jgi:hypothetical protein
MLTPVTPPLASRSTSNTENGRRNNGSVTPAGLTITNWPGFVRRPTSGAARLSTE